MSAARRRIAPGAALLVAALLGLVLLRLLLYRDPGDGGATWGWPGLAIGRFRLVAIAVGTIAGAALATSGLLLQALLRNPLASPYVLGLSSGAALGVMLAIWVGATRGVAIPEAGHAAPALLGALAALGVVYLLGQRRGWIDPLALLLVGVVVSSICAALILGLQHLVPHGLKGDFVVWMTGHVRQGAPTAALVVAGSATLLGVGAAALLGPAMDAATLGDDEARSVGLDLPRLRLALFALAGLLAAVAVALAGPIGFVGLVAPHAARLLVGPAHRTLVVASALAGAALLVGADVATQALPIGGGRLPAGVFTALLGGPAFLWLLRRGRVGEG